jgi:ferric-dicitrate binding protein FerR (iron transport regulator)
LVISALSSRRSGAYWEATMKKKRQKRTPEEQAEFAEWERRSKANLQRLYELVDRGWAELERKGIAKRPSY